MKAIWKWALDSAEVTLDMPEGARLLDVQLQDGSPVLWALVSRQGQKCSRTFNIVPDDAGRYIGTFQMADGRLVFHVFEP